MYHLSYHKIDVCQLAGHIIHIINLTSPRQRLYYGGNRSELEPVRMMQLKGLKRPNGIAINPVSDNIYISDAHPESNRWEV